MSSEPRLLRDSQPGDGPVPMGGRGLGAERPGEASPALAPAMPGADAGDPDGLADPVALHTAHWPETWDGRIHPFIYALHRVREQHMRRTETICARYGLTPAELDVLATLRRSPLPWVLTPSQLRRAVLITSGGLAKVLHQLEERGLVERLADPDDRRVKPVKLTAAGLPLIEGVVRDLLDQTQTWLCERLSDAEIAQAASLLGKLGGAQRGSGAPPPQCADR